MTTTTGRQSKPASAGEPACSARAAKFLGTVISGRYRLDAVVSETAASAVYRAEHTLMHKRIAVKLLHPEAAARPAAVARFEREALAGAHVDHPNIALAKDFGTLDDGSCFLVMEYLEGQALRDAIRAGGLGVERALRIARQLALALDAAHAIGVVHTAVTPENVRLVERGGERDIVKLVDFGSALLPAALLASSAESASVAQRVPTAVDPQAAAAAYTAPEIIDRKPADGRADLYSLGIVLWEMIAGTRFDIRRTGPPPSLVALGAPARVDALVQKMVVAAPESRTARAIDVVEAIDAALTEMRAPRASLSVVDSGPHDATVLSTDKPSLLASVSQPAMHGLAQRAATSFRSAGVQATRLADLPPAIRLCIAGAVGIIVLVVGAVAFRSPEAEQGLSTSGAAPASASGSSDRSTAGLRVPPSAGGDARIKPPDVDGTDERADSDASALAERFVREVGSGQLKGAVTTLDYLTKQNPKAADDPEVRAAAVKLSQRVTHVRDSTPDTFFEIVTNQMGARGIDILFEIITTRGESDAAERSLKILRDPAVRNRGTPAFRIAYDLRMAKGCNDRIGLLDRARDEADKRSMRTLLALSEQCGGRGAECCDRNDSRVAAAIDAVRARSRETD